MPTNLDYKQKDYKRKWRQAHKEQLRIARKGYYQKHRECILAYSKARHQGIKRLILNHYSNGSCVCAVCGFSDTRALSIDHINGGGGEHRRLTTKAGIDFYQWLIKNNYPPGYQVLCLNCNWIKRMTNNENRRR